VSKWLSRAGVKNTDAISFIGEYDYKTTTDIISLERDGVRITEKKDVSNDDIDIEKEDMYSKGNLQAVINGGILNIYTKRTNLKDNEDKIIQVINYNSDNNKDKSPVIFNTSNPLDISLNIKEGFPEGEEGNASTIDIGYNNVKFYDDIKLGDYWVSSLNDVFYDDPIKKEYDKFTSVNEKEFGKLNIGDYVRIKNDETEENVITYKKGIYEVVSDDDSNKILEFYCENIDIKKEGLSVQGYSSKNVKYIALSFNDGENDEIPKSIDNEMEVKFDWEKETENILRSIYEINCVDGGDAGGTTTPQIRYPGLNANDYLGELGGAYSGMRTVKFNGWKGMQTYLKESGSTNVKLSGVSWNGNSDHSGVDITDELMEVYKNPNNQPNVDVIKKNERYYVIAVCDNYTNLSDDEYDEEKIDMYSVIKPHTSRFAIIKLYKIK
jgi:hypothetical protein